MPCRTSIRLAAVAAAGLAAALAGCSDSAAPDRPSPAVTGTVLDATGAPVADAAVVLDLDFVTGPADPDKPRTAIAFDLPEPGHFSLRVTDVCDDEIFYALDDSAAAGSHMIQWDGTDQDGLLLGEGFYHAHFQFEDLDPRTFDIALARNLGDEQGMFATVACTEVHDTWRVSAWTDAEGRFRIERGCWEFGESTPWVNESGDIIGTWTVAPRVRVWAYPADRSFGAASAWVDFDAVQGAEAPVVLPAVDKPRD
ncbi:MAG: hypothetical protein R6X35_04580 [Candidatus Krumholzibacteriia bacterium]